MKLKFRPISSVITAAFCLVAWAASSQAQTKPKAAPGSGYHLLQRIEVGGEGGWDYLFADSAAHRLYVSHATKVVVIDTEANAVVGEIANTNGIHGVAVAAEFGRGFTSNGRDNSVTIFDLKTLNVLGQVKVGTNPDCILYDDATKRVFAFNRGSSNVTAFAAKDGAIAGTIELGGHPEFATSDGKGMIYVNLDDKSEVVPIDARQLKAQPHWSVAPGEDPSGMAIDRKTRRLYIVCGNKKMVVMDAASGQIKATLSIGEGPDAAGFDPETKLAFSSNGEGTLTIIQADGGDKFSVIDNIATQRGARTMAVDSKTHRIYLATAQFGPPPAPTPERPRPRPSIVPNSFVILVFGK